MKEQKITAFIGLYGSIILANQVKSDTIAILFIIQAVFWLARYAYFKYYY